MTVLFGEGAPALFGAEAMRTNARDSLATYLGSGLRVAPLFGAQVKPKEAQENPGPKHEASDSLIGPENHMANFLGMFQELVSL